MLVHILEGFSMKYRCYSFYDARKVSDDTGLECLDASLAVQSQKDEADINHIVRMFGVTGKLPQSVRVPTYGDFDGVDDYQSALAAIREAEDAFAKMPSEVRIRFGHDPQQFVEFCSDESNLEEMRKLGLAVPAPTPETA